MLFSRLSNKVTKGKCDAQDSYKNRGEIAQKKHSISGNMPGAYVNVNTWENNSHFVQNSQTKQMKNNRISVIGF